MVQPVRLSLVDWFQTHDLVGFYAGRFALRPVRAVCWRIDRELVRILVSDIESRRPVWLLRDLRCARRCLAGLVLGLSAARLVAWVYGPGFGRELLGALAALLLVSGVSALICRVLADIPPTIDGHGLTLEVEFRFPNTFGTDTVPTSVGDWQFTLASVVGRTRRAYLDGTIQTDAARHENGQWIVPASVELFTERGSRSVTLAPRDASEVMSFLLPLPARPDASFEQWSVWLPRQQANGEPWPADKCLAAFAC